MLRIRNADGDVRAPSTPALVTKIRRNPSSDEMLHSESDGIQFRIRRRFIPDWTEPFSESVERIQRPAQGLLAMPVKALWEA